MRENPELSLQDWHSRYQQQASWSRDVRQYLFGKTKIGPDEKILEVGSGTGAVLNILSKEISCQLFGIDIDLPSLQFSATRHPKIHHTAADGFHLPFLNDDFSITYCHYLLLWIQSPLEILIEMTRVTKSGGSIIALAEPDYQGRIDYPQPLDDLGQQQTQALESQGVDTCMGRKLAGMFSRAGLKEVTVGILGSQWDRDKTQKIDKNEWMMIRSDLLGKLSAETLESYRRAEVMAREIGERILFIPTFYALGIVP